MITRGSLRSVAVGLSLMISAWGASAEEGEVHELEEIVVTAARVERETEKVPQASKIVTAEEIERRGARTVGEAVFTASGVQIQNYGAIGALSGASIRGSTTSQVLVLVDGVRFNPAQSGGADLSTIPVDNVERIEIVRGGSSAIHGADAMGGVINIITKGGRRDAGNLTTFSVRNGFFPYRRYAEGGGSEKTYFRAEDLIDTQTYSISHQGNLQPLAFSLGGSFTDARNRYVYNDLQRNPRPRENAQLRGWDLFGKMVWNVDPTNSLQLSTQYYDALKGVPGDLSNPSPNAEQTDRNLLLNLSYNTDRFFIDPLTLNVKAFYNRLDLGYKDPTNPYGAIDSRHPNIAYGAQSTQEFYPLPWQTFTYGWDIRLDRTESDELGEKERLSNGIFLQSETNFLNSLVIVPAARYDMYSDFGDHLSPRAGIICNLPFNITVKSNYGLSFRAPTFNDLYWPEDAFAKGNPNLKPEEGREFDLGFTKKFEEARVGSTFFQKDVYNAILWAPQSDGKWAPSNVGRARFQGLESELTLQPSPWLDLNFNHTYLRTIAMTGGLTEEDDRRLPYEPEHTFNFIVDVHRDIWGLWLAGHYQSLRYLTISNKRFLPSLFTADVGTSIEPLKSLVFSLEIKNIFNEEYELISGYPMPGVQVNLGVKYGLDWGKTTE